MTRLLPVGVCLGLTALWWLAASGSPIFPTPGAVLLGIASLVKDGTLLRHVTASLYRVTYGYGIALLLALPLGILMGWSRTAFTAFNPVVQMLRPISPIAWIPLAILWFGVGDLSPMFLVFLASFFPMVLATSSGVHLVERESPGSSCSPTSSSPARFRPSSPACGWGWASPGWSWSRRRWSRSTPDSASSSWIPAMPECGTTSSWREWS